MAASTALYDSAPRLTDGTVVLDAFEPEDAANHLAGEDDEMARRFGWFPRRSSPASVGEAITHWRDQWSTQGPVRAFALRLAESNELIGGCELRLGQGNACRSTEPSKPVSRAASMSYWTFPRFRRRGLATRAVALATRFAFDTLGVTEIELEIEPDNVSSRRVAERAGFAEAGTTQTSPGSGAAARPMLRFVLRS
jgi:RimJ/RimL family protein N-acetyltransferase